MGLVVGVLTLLAVLVGLALGIAAIRLRVNSNPVAERINALLPQTQCAQCGFPGCRPYSEAIAAGAADINRCPPGGEATIRSLADLLGREPQPLDAECGEAKPPTVAIIDEAVCIGCTICIQACPVDAIVGGPRHMHTVIDAECTGCELCVAPCPVDCIDMIPRPDSIGGWRWPKPAAVDPRRMAGVS